MIKYFVCLDEFSMSCDIYLLCIPYEPHLEKTVVLQCKNKDADQLCSDREADQRLFFRYMDSAIPLLPKSEISSLWPSSVVVQPGLCQTWSETHNEAHITGAVLLHESLTFCLPVSSADNLGKQFRP